MIKKRIVILLIFSLVLGNLMVLANPAQAKTLQEALEEAKTKWTENALEVAKKLTNKVLDAIETWLKNAKAMVSVNPHFSQEQKARINTAIDKALAWMPEVRFQVEKATDIDELKSVTQKAKSEWQDLQVEIKLAYAESWLENGNKFIEKLEAIYDKIEEFKTNLETGDYQVDTSKLEDLLGKLNIEINESKGKLEEAKNYVEKMKTVTGAEAFSEFLKAREAVTQALINLVDDARPIYKEALAELARLIHKTT